MEALIFVLVLIPVVLVVLMIMLLSKITGLTRELEIMRTQLAGFMRNTAAAQPATPQTDDPGTTPPATTVQPPAPAAAAPSQVTPPPVAPPPAEAPPSMIPKEEIPIQRTEEDELRERRLAAMVGSYQEPAVPAASRRPAATVEVRRPGFEPPPMPPAAPPRKRQPSFWDRNPDLEKFIGENLMNKIGITVLVIGIGLFLRYAIDKGLISETAQTMIGLLAGGILVFFAHRLRESFRAFSSVLVGGGIAVFYFSIATAFHQYQIIGQTAAFITMIAITGVAVLLTLAYDRKELAVISLLGGFATPFMVATGEGNFKVLFTYLLILNIGMLVLSNYKKWHLINVLSFALTLMIFGGWMLGPYDGMEPPPALAAFGFATAFFLVFFGMNLRYNLRHRQAFAELDHVLLLVNTAAYYGAGIYLLSDLTVRVNGLFTVLLGLFYLLFALYFHRREGIPASLKFMLIGLVLTFISLAAPVQLEGNHITLFWAAEAVLLLWFAQRTGLRLVERGAMVVSGLMVVSLWMDLIGIYGEGPEEALVPLFNKGWITGMVAALSLALTTSLLYRSDRKVEVLPGFKRSHWSLCAVVLGAAIFFLVNYLEIRHQLGRIYMAQVVNMALMCWTLLFLLALDFFLRNRNGWRNVPVVLMMLAALIYVTAFYLSSRAAFHVVVTGEPASGAYVFHYLGVVLMAVTVFRLIQFGRKRIDRSADGWAMHLWAVAIFLVFFASQELDHVMVLANNSSDALIAARRIGYPILWGVGSFLFMWLGMRHRLRMLRVIALFLFGITLLKLFLFDLGSLSEGGRVAAFIFLGALLLVISFMYQKLKGLVMADGPDTPPLDDAKG